MYIGWIFWMIMIVWAIFGGIYRDNPRFLLGSSIMIFVLFFILGWHSFGFVVHN